MCPAAGDLPGTSLNCRLQNIFLDIESSISTAFYARSSYFNVKNLLLAKYLVNEAGMVIALLEKVNIK